MHLWYRDHEVFDQSIFSLLLMLLDLQFNNGMKPSLVNWLIY